MLFVTVEAGHRMRNSRRCRRPVQWPICRQRGETISRRLDKCFAAFPGYSSPLSSRFEKVENADTEGMIGRSIERHHAIRALPRQTNSIRQKLRDYNSKVFGRIPGSADEAYPAVSRWPNSE